MVSNFKIGTTLAGMQTLDAIGVKIDPRVTYKPYAALSDNNDGTVRGIGWASAEWAWDYIPNEQKAFLLGYCTSASALVYITTRLNDGTFNDFSAVMVKPVEEKIDSSKSIDFKILFRKLVAV